MCLTPTKHIAVLGAGESGEAAAVLLKGEGAMVTVLDTAEENKLRKKIDALGARGIRVIAGLAAEHESLHGHYDSRVLSPGIDPAVPLVQNFLKRRIEMIGELELAYEMCACPIIGITGTNGKTTTTQLVEKMLNACGVKTVAAGNIGPAFSARVRQSAQLDVMTLEISSFQLETIRRFRAQIAVWLGFAPDHLDRYRVDGGVLRGEDPHLRKPDRGGLGDRQFARQTAAARRAQDHLQRLRRAAAISSCATA